LAGCRTATDAIAILPFELQSPTLSSHRDPPDQATGRVGSEAPSLAASA